MMTEYWGYILLSLLFSAFFSGAEVAFVTQNKLEMELEKKQKGILASILKIFYKYSDQFLTALFIGNSIALVCAVFFIIRVFNPPLDIYISSPVTQTLLLIFIAFVLIFLIGELIPRIIARIIPSHYLSYSSIPLFLFFIFFYPLSKIAMILSWLTFRLFGVRIPFVRKSKVLSRGDLGDFIQKTIEDSPQSAELDKEVRLFRNALDFSQAKLRDCIVPRTEIVALKITSDIDELLSKFVETGLSKILIYKDDIDNIIGYIHSSEMFARPEDWTKRINPVSLVPENMAAKKLMKNMLEEKRSIAVVVDEFGGTSGVITMEDLVEEIFGDIEDEHDTKLYVAKKISENEYILSGRLEIHKINEMFGLDIPESDEYITVSGYILNHHQNFPKLNETIEMDNFVIKIVKMTTTKIELVRLKINK